MILLKKILSVIEIVIIMVAIVFGYNKAYAQAIEKREKPVKAAVLLYRFDDAYTYLLRQALEDIQKNNEGNVEFTFYDGKNDQSVQNKTLDEVLQGDGVDLILLDLVDIKDGNEAISKIKERNIPVVLFSREPNNIDVIKSYNKAFFVGTNGSQAGVLQGNILVNEWNKNKVAIDVNGDKIMQYIMLMGERNNKEAIERTEYSVSTINEAGIKTQQLALAVGNWDRQTARELFEPLFLSYGNKIETIISNNDEMAIGAIEVLQKYGYNKGAGTKTFPVVGVDAIPAAQELIKKGEMTGSVIQDAPAMAEACYKIGINLVDGKNPLDATDYKFDDTGVAVRIPYKEYKG